jgi:hypothetical protein
VCESQPPLAQADIAALADDQVIVHIDVEELPASTICLVISRSSGLGEGSPVVNHDQGSAVPQEGCFEDLTDTNE